MGKGNKPDTSAQYNTALTQANTKSPQEEALGKAALKTIDWADKGDFTDPSEGGIFVNYADPAIRRRHRELELNAGGQGVLSGMGGAPDPNQLAAMKQNLADENAEDAAGQYEEDIRGGIGSAMGIAGDVSKTDLSRRLGVLDVTGANYRQQANKPAWWERLIGGASQMGSSFAGSAGGSAALAAMI